MDHLQPDATHAAVEAARLHAATALALAARALQQTSRLQVSDAAAPEFNSHAVAASAEDQPGSGADDYSSYSAAAKAAGDGTAWDDHTAGFDEAPADDADTAADAAVAAATEAANAAAKQVELDARPIAMTAEIAAKSAAMAAITDAKAALAVKAKLESLAPTSTGPVSRMALSFEA